MKLERMGLQGLDYAPCRYGLSRLDFRGPARALDGDYVACIGGTQTYGRFVPVPFPDLLEDLLGVPCVNFGVVNAGVDAFGRDPAMLAACHDAVATVVQVMGAQNQTNRFYSVHPRRNDRFVKPSAALTTLYPDVDFAEFAFTRHMLAGLEQVSPERFELVRGELQAVWTHRMTALLRNIGGPVVLFWFADHAPGEAREDVMRTDPLFVTGEMIETLRSQAKVDLVEVLADPAATEGMVFSRAEAGAAAELPGPAAHEAAAGRLAGAVRRALQAP